MLPFVRERAAIHRVNEDLGSFLVTARGNIGSNPKIAQFDREGAATKADLDSAAAQVIQHADLLKCPQRVVEVEQHDQRTNAKSPCALYDA